MITIPRSALLFCFLTGLALALATCSQPPGTAAPSPTADAVAAGPTATAPPASATALTLPPTATSAPPTATSAPPTATPLPPTATSAPPTATPLPPTATSAPLTATPLPPTPTLAPPTPTLAPTPLWPDWLAYLNRFRAMASVPPLSERAALTLGSNLHSQYMVVNDAAIAHRQDPENPLYNPAGDQAARNGNIFATSQLDANYIWSVNFWISAPFHLVPMLAPDLARVGYGDYVEEGGSVGMAAVLDVRSGDRIDQGPVSYPLFFPRDGSATWIVRHSLFEWPDPLTACPGFTRPAGAPIVVQLGDGSLVPDVGTHALYLGDQPLETCLFDETTYTNPDAYAQRTGRIILDLQDAVVIMPRRPLAADQTYRVYLEANGQSYSWQFTTQKRPDSAPAN